MQGGAITQYKQIYTHWVGIPQTGKYLYDRDSPTEGKSSEPHIRFPYPGIWNWEKEPPDHLALKASEVCAQELHGTGRNGDPILERCTQDFMCIECQGKAETT